MEPHFEKYRTKTDHISLTFIRFFFSQLNLVFKFNLVFIDILDNFCHCLFICLTLDYHLWFHWSWSPSSLTLHFLIRAPKILTRLGVLLIFEGWKPQNVAIIHEWPFSQNSYIFTKCFCFSQKFLLVNDKNYSWPY